MAGAERQGESVAVWDTPCCLASTKFDTPLCAQYDKKRYIEAYSKRIQSFTSTHIIAYWHLITEYKMHQAGQKLQGGGGETRRNWKSFCCPHAEEYGYCRLLYF